MENRLLHVAKSLFDQETVDILAKHEDLDASQVNRGLDAAIPTLFLGLQQKSGAALQEILDQIKSIFIGYNFSDYVHNWRNNPEESGLGPKIGQVIQSIFPDNFQSILGKIGQFLNIDQGKVGSIFKSAIPTVVAAITQQGTHWDAPAIERDLKDNRSSFLAALPAGLNLDIFGNTELESPKGPVIVPPIEGTTVVEEVDPVRDVLVGDPVVHTEPRGPRALEPQEEERKKGGGLWWMIIPILLLILWFVFGKSCNREETTAVDTSANSAMMTDTLGMEDTTLSTTMRESIMVTLPDGSTLNAYKGGIEDQLVAFLQTDYSNLSDEDLKNKWFDFDNLNFETNTANIMEESKAQVANIAAILKAFPNVKIKIGGYTDKTGDEAVNKKISNERAIAVKNALSDLSVGNQVMATEGYGSEFAKAAADAPESDRVKDRRVSISVRK